MPAVATETVPENWFGSGTAIVPPVPYTSNSGARVAQTSKLNVTVDSTPLAWLEHARDVRLDLHGDRLARARPRRDDAVVAARGWSRPHPLHRSEQLHEGRSR